MTPILVVEAVQLALDSATSSAQLQLRFTPTRVVLADEAALTPKRLGQPLYRITIEEVPS